MSWRPKSGVRESARAVEEVHRHFGAKSWELKHF